MSKDDPQITLTWSQHGLLVDVLVDFVDEYVGSDVAMAKRILRKLFDAEARWWAAHPEAQAELDELKRRARRAREPKQITARASC